MIQQFLKAGGVRTIDEFYKKFPTEEHFNNYMRMGGGLYAYQPGGGRPPSKQEVGDPYYQQQLAEQTAKVTPVETQTSQIPAIPVVSPTGSYKLNPYKGVSIVDFLKTQGKASSMVDRKALANIYGIKNYKGSASQNQQLMKLIQDNPTDLSNFNTIAAPVSIENYEKTVAKMKKKGTNVSKPTATQKGVVEATLKQNIETPYPLPQFDPSAYPKLEAGPAQEKKTGAWKKMINDAMYNKALKEYYGKKTKKEIEKEGSLVDRTSQKEFNDFLVDFFSKEVPLTVATAGMGNALKGLRWGAKYLPYGLKEIPRGSSYVQKALPGAQKLLPPSGPTNWVNASGFAFSDGGDYSGTYSAGVYYKQGGNVFDQFGGQYQKGGEYDLSEDEIQDLIDKGYKIEYL